MKKIFVLTLVLVVAMTSLLAIPASAAYVSHAAFSNPNCCGTYFYGIYRGGVYSFNTVRAYAQVNHDCEWTTAYVSAKCWVAPWSNTNNYRSSTYTASDGGTTTSAASVDQTFDHSTTVLLGVEAYYKVTVEHFDEVYVCQARSNDGDIPLSYNPPVVTE